MIKSCSECKTPCCRKGPGPWEPIPFDDFMEDFESTDNYNTRCEHFKNNKCELWGTPELPIACRQFVCHVREFSKQELAEIDAIRDWAPCENPKCECGYTLWGLNEDGFYQSFCELCGWLDEQQWTTANGTKDYKDAPLISDVLARKVKIRKRTTRKIKLQPKEKSIQI